MNRIALIITGACLLVSGFLSPAAAQGSAIANMNYHAWTTVGTSSMCAYEGVCEGGSNTGKTIDGAKDWVDAIEKAETAGVEPVDLGYAPDPAITDIVER